MCVFAQKVQFYAKIGLFWAWENLQVFFFREFFRSQSVYFMYQVIRPSRVKWETVHCYPQNADDWTNAPECAVEGGLMLLLFISYQNGRCDQFVLLYNKLLNNWPLGEHWILFLSNLSVSWDEVEDSPET